MSPACHAELLKKGKNTYYTCIYIYILSSGDKAWQKSKTKNVIPVENERLEAENDLSKTGKSPMYLGPEEECNKAHYSRHPNSCFEGIWMSRVTLPAQTMQSEGDILQH